MSHKGRKRGTPQSHRVTFAGHDKWEVLRKVSEWLKAQHNASDLVFVGKEDGPDSLYRKGVDMLNRDYHEDVKDLANGIIENILEGELTDDDWSDRLHESVDGHQRVIYTAYAQATLMLVQSESFKDGIPWSQLAYGALYEDVRERLDHLKIGKYDRDNETKDPLEPACEWEYLDDDKIKATFEFKDTELVGTGDDREEALADLRKNYEAEQERKRQERSAARDRGESASNR